MSHRLSEACVATAIPAGTITTLPAGTEVDIAQTLGGNVTVRTGAGLFRIPRDQVRAIEGFDLPFETAAESADPSAPSAPFSEAAIWDVLKTCFDPEIPVNIVDLGLVYDLEAGADPSGGHSVDVKMTLTAQGCGMGPTIAEDARQKIAALPGVTSARVHIVWDPVWNPRMISPEGRKLLGLE